MNPSISSKRMTKPSTQKITKNIVMTIFFGSVPASKIRKGKNNSTYFDTNLSNHHHFYDNETSELIDINENQVKFEKIPNAPNGKKIANVEVIINLKG